MTGEWPLFSAADLRDRARFVLLMGVNEAPLSGVRAGGVAGGARGVSRTDGGTRNAGEQTELLVSAGDIKGDVVLTHASMCVISQACTITGHWAHMY